MDSVVEVEIAAPPESVWEWLVDDDKIGRYDSEVISRQVDGSTVIRTGGRARRASIVISDQTYPSKLEKTFSTPLYRSVETFALEPCSTGTRLTFHVRSTLIGPRKFLQTPSRGRAVSRILTAHLAFLKSLIESDAGFRIESTDEIRDEMPPSRRALRGEKLFRNESDEVRVKWKRASPEVQNATSYYCVVGIAMPHPDGARFVVALADISRKRIPRRLAFDGTFLVAMLGLSIYSAWNGIYLLTAYCLFFAYRRLPCLISLPTDGRRRVRAAVTENSEFLKWHEQVEDLIQKTRSSQPEVRRRAIALLGELEFLGPLNLRAEAALAAVAKQNGPLGEIATAALKSRRDRAWLAAA